MTAMPPADHPHIRVACALIERDDLVLAAQRSEGMRMPLKWEFPGGKIEAGETAEACLRRELAEEMGIAVQIVRPLPPHTHRYPTFTVTLHPFVCAIAAGEISLAEHRRILWLPPAALAALDWAAADFPIIAAYRASLKALGA
jgi:8-oxo-dGTP diphosphatase